MTGWLKPEWLESKGQREGPLLSPMPILAPKVQFDPARSLTAVAFLTSEKGACRVDCLAIPTPGAAVGAAVAEAVSRHANEQEGEDAAEDADGGDLANA